MNKRIEDELRRALHQPEAAQERMERTVAAAKAQRKAPAHRIGFMAFLLRQVGFVGWRTWLFQGLALIVLLIGLQVGLSYDMQDLQLRHTPALLGSCGVLIILTTLPMIGRAMRYRMQEVETAARFSFPHILTARLIIIGTGDVIMLSGLVAFIMTQTKIGLASALFYAIVPSSLLFATLLTLLPQLPNRWFTGVLMTVGCGEIAAICLLNVLWPGFTMQSFGIGWGILCALMLVAGSFTAIRTMCRTAFADAYFSAV